MKESFEKVILMITIMLNNQLIAYAGTSKRMDKQLLEAILIFLQSCSYFMLVLSIGMFFYSIKNEDGAKKTDSLKVFGISLLLMSLRKIAEVGGLI